MYIGHRRGHNFKTVGAEGIIKEVESCEIIHNLVDRYLSDMGEHHINLNPPNFYGKNDITLTISKANNEHVDLYFSIHENKYDGNANGCEVWVYDKPFPQADMVLNNLVNLGFKNRGIKSSVKEDRSLGELKHTIMQAMIIEVCFCDSQKDVDLINKVGYESIAKAIVEGVTGKSYNLSTNDKKGVYQVVTESFAIKDNAVEYQKRLKELGVNSFIDYKRIEVK